jgi:outer membrane receptor protein involved in Fe transport
MSSSREEKPRKLLVQDGARRGLHSLQLSLAGRYEDYSDFGRAFSPQAGVIWEPVAGIRLRGAYSEAFRAPAVTLQREGSITVLTAIVRPDPLQPGGTPVLQYLGSQPGIGPEEAKTWSVGLDFTPRFMSAGKLSLSYFNIDYRERIGAPALGVDLALVLEREDRFPGLVNRSPAAADIDALLAIRPSVSNSTGTPIAQPVTGASVLAAFPGLVLFDGRTANLAVEKVDGIDLSVERRLDTGLGRIELGLNGNYTFNHFSRLTAVSPAIDGLDEVSKPVQFRVRARASWQRDRWSANAYLNHSPAYNNPFVTPTGRVQSWTTVDFTLGLDVGGLLRGGFLPHDMRLSLTARNLLDRSPPLLVGALANTLLYDPTNANAEGRILALRVVSRW